jgi:S1-C subfamily serine protease
MKSIILKGSVKLYLIAFLFFVGCASTVSTTNNANFPSTPINEPVHIFGLSDLIPTSAKEIGTVKIGDSGFSVDCGYERVIELAKVECRRIGGNALKIIRLNHPDGYSTCYRLSAYILRIDPASIPRHPNTNQNTISYGTAFAINNQGYILTNYHVLEGSSNYSVIGINEDFNKKYTAELIISDQTNDLAILKIGENINFGNIPYSFINTISEVGDNVYALGYPLRATMGDEIKLTNGIISANSGFAGDISSYQISVPVQPGNSGGPLFDADGNIVGIINAKHTGAENVSYAIKIPYLYNLIQVSGKNIQLNNQNTLRGKRLSDQVRDIRKFVFIIEAR